MAKRNNSVTFTGDDHVFSELENKLDEYWLDYQLKLKQEQDYYALQLKIEKSNIVQNQYRSTLEVLGKYENKTGLQILAHQNNMMVRLNIPDIKEQKNFKFLGPFVELHKPMCEKSTKTDFLHPIIYCRTTKELQDYLNKFSSKVIGLLETCGMIKDRNFESGKADPFSDPNIPIQNLLLNHRPLMERLAPASVRQKVYELQTQYSCVMPAFTPKCDAVDLYDNNIPKNLYNMLNHQHYVMHPQVKDGVYCFQMWLGITEMCESQDKTQGKFRYQNYMSGWRTYAFQKQDESYCVFKSSDESEVSNGLIEPVITFDAESELLSSLADVQHESTTLFHIMQHEYLMRIVRDQMKVNIDMMHYVAGFKNISDKIAHGVIKAHINKAIEEINSLILDKTFFTFNKENRWGALKVKWESFIEIMTNLLKDLNTLPNQNADGLTAPHDADRHCTDLKTIEYIYILEQFNINNKILIAQSS